MSDFEKISIELTHEDAYSLAQFFYGVTSRDIEGVLTRHDSLVPMEKIVAVESAAERFCASVREALATAEEPIEE